MKKQILTIAIILISISSEAKLIDKIAGIVDDNVITLSQLQRMSKSLPLKKNIAPNIYDKTAYTNEEFLNLSVNNKNNSSNPGTPSFKSKASKKITEPSNKKEEISKFFMILHIFWIDIKWLQ
mgnify:CR=1 FL=1